MKFLKQRSLDEAPAEKKVFSVIMAVVYGLTIAAMAAGVGFIYWKLLGVLK